ncbi:unnamed protein product [Closterium sp. NIES-54]
MCGESMGGAVAICIHRKQPDQWDGAIFMAPMCKISAKVQPPAILVRLLKGLAYVIPTWQIVPSADIVTSAIRCPEKLKKPGHTPTVLEPPSQCFTQTKTPRPTSPPSPCPSCCSTGMPTQSQSWTAAKRCSIPHSLFPTPLDIPFPFPPHPRTPLPYPPLTDSSQPIHLPRSPAHANSPHHAACEQPSPCCMRTALTMLHANSPHHAAACKPIAEASLPLVSLPFLLLHGDADTIAANPYTYRARPRMRTALTMLHASQDAEASLDSVSLPFLLLHGDADIVTELDGSQALYDRARSEDKTLKVYEGAWHLLTEGEPEETAGAVLRDMIGWLDERSQRKSSKLMGFALCKKRGIIPFSTTAFNLILQSLES